MKESRRSNHNADSLRSQPRGATISSDLTNVAGLIASDASGMNPAITVSAARLMAQAIQDGSTLHGHQTRSRSGDGDEWMLRVRNASGWTVIVRTASFERYHGHVMYWLELREMQKCEMQKRRGKRTRMAA